MTKTKCVKDPLHVRWGGIPLVPVASPQWTGPELWMGPRQRLGFQIWFGYSSSPSSLLYHITGSQVSLFHYFQRLILDCTYHLIGPFLPLDRGNDDWQWRLLLWRIHHIKWVRIIIVSMFFSKYHHNSRWILTAAHCVSGEPNNPARDMSVPFHFY